MCACVRVCVSVCVRECVYSHAIDVFPFSSITYYFRTVFSTQLVFVYFYFFVFFRNSCDGEFKGNV